jgi:hypothetical protein
MLRRGRNFPTFQMCLQPPDGRGVYWDRTDDVGNLKNVGQFLRDYKE